MRGAKNVHTQRSQPTRNRVSITGRRPSSVRWKAGQNLCKRGRTEQTVQTFPRGSNELNFGYHVFGYQFCFCKNNKRMIIIECGPSHVPQADSRKRLFQCSVYQSLRTSHGHTHALISPLYYTTHHSCITHYILHTQYAPHLAGVLGRGSRSLNPPAAVLVLKVPERDLQ